MRTIDDITDDEIVEAVAIATRHGNAASAYITQVLTAISRRWGFMGDFADLFARLDTLTIAGRIVQSQPVDVYFRIKSKYRGGVVDEVLD